MNLNQLKEKFDNEWVLLAEPLTDAEGKIIGGRVIAHDRDRDKVYSAGIKHKPKRSDILCFAKMPDGSALLM